MLVSVDITVVTGLDNANGTVEYATEASGAADTRVVLRDASGRPVAEGVAVPEEP